MEDTHIGSPMSAFEGQHMHGILFSDFRSHSFIKMFQFRNQIIIIPVSGIGWSNRFIEDIIASHYLPFSVAPGQLPP